MKKRAATMCFLLVFANPFILNAGMFDSAVLLSPSEIPDELSRKATILDSAITSIKSDGLDPKTESINTDKAIIKGIYGIIAGKEYYDTIKNRIQPFENKLNNSEELEKDEKETLKKIADGLAEGRKPNAYNTLASYPKDISFGGISIDPNSTTQELKVSIVNYNLKYGEKENLVIPFSLLSAALSGGGTEEARNSRRLLDTDQGTLNVSIPIGTKFRYNDVLDFIFEDEGYLFLGANLNGRYIETEGDDTTGSYKTASSLSFAGKLGANMVLPIYGIDVTDRREGSLSFNIGTAAFYQEPDEAILYFKGKTDNNGNTVKFDDWYYGWNIGGNFQIFNWIGVSVSYYAPFTNQDYLEEVFKFAINISYPDKQK